MWSGIQFISLALPLLTHWRRVTHICISKLTITGSDNGLSPRRRQATIWTIAGILLIGPLGTNFSEILIGIQTFSFKKMHLKMSSGKRRPCLGLNVLNIQKHYFIKPVLYSSGATAQDKFNERLFLNIQLLYCGCRWFGADFIVN